MFSQDFKHNYEFTTITGSGFFVKEGASWTIKGIVSASTFKNNGECDVGRFAVYTKVKEFSAWIRSVIS